MRCWQKNCQDLKNKKLQYWVSDPASTCAKLPDLEIKLIKTLKIEETGQNQIWLRESELLLGSKPWMVAYAKLFNASRKTLECFQSKKPLGRWLFADDSGWKRSSFLYNIDDSEQVGKNKLLKQAIVARKSEFVNDCKAKIILTEIFLKHHFWEGE
jgi:chorismate-pyruvate lyase